MKVCEKCLNEIDTKDGENCCAACDSEKRKKRNARARERRRAMADALDGLNMKRVRGGLGGTYYE